YRPARTASTSKSRATAATRRHLAVPQDRWTALSAAGAVAARPISTEPAVAVAANQTSAHARQRTLRASRPPTRATRDSWSQAAAVAAAGVTSRSGAERAGTPA